MILLSQKNNDTFTDIESTFKLVNNRSHPDLLILDIDSLDIEGEKNEGKKRFFKKNRAQSYYNFKELITRNHIFIFFNIILFKRLKKKT